MNNTNRINEHQATPLPVAETDSDALAVLPDEMLVQVFRHFDVRDLNSAGSCSTRMRRVANSDVLWRAFFLERFCESALLPEGVKVQYITRLNSEKQAGLQHTLGVHLDAERPDAVMQYFSRGGRCFRHRDGNTIVRQLVMKKWRSEQSFLNNLDAYLLKIRTNPEMREALSVWDPTLNNQWGSALFQGRWMVQAFLDRGADPEAGSQPGHLHHKNGSVLQLARALALNSPERYQPLVKLLEDTVQQRKPA